MKAIIQSYNLDSGKAVMQTCIPFIKLKEIAKFTARTRPEIDPYETTDSNEYQRELNLKHVKEIIDYIKKTIRNAESSNSVALFPTSMLIAFNNDEQHVGPNAGELIEISLPDSCYIVDGQHRLKAMMELYKEGDSMYQSFLENYKFNCTILLNFDIWEQAKVFADVNFKQKKVNKSLYYDIYGTFHPEDSSDYKQNVIYLAHSLVEYLNNSPKSPLYKSIKMLGNGNGVISQAFLVEALLMHISSPRGIWYFDSNKQTVDKTILTPMKSELFTYLDVIKTEFSNIWDSPDYIIRKTTGLGALIRLMGYIHKILNNNDIPTLGNIDEDFICSTYKRAITPYISEIKKHESDLFPKNGAYAGSGGKGLELRLYRRLKEIIDPNRKTERIM